MSTIRRFSAEETTPERDKVLDLQGIPRGSTVPPRVRELIDEALECFPRLAEPAGLWTSISTTEFDSIYRGEGRNAERTPLAEIFPRASALALFAVTIGPGICDEISSRFAAGDPASGFALDTVASAGAERLAERLAGAFGAELDPPTRHRSVLPYSPGYCGWHVSGQRRLFAALEPERIGIMLNDSCLMSPIKSVSGVFVAGDEECHSFEVSFEFCTLCTDQNCRDRLQTAFPR